MAFPALQDSPASGNPLQGPRRVHGLIPVSPTPPRSRSWDLPSGRLTACLERLQVILRIDLGSGKQPYSQNCLVDTGAFLSLFPEYEWRQFAAQILWLTLPNLPHAPPLPADGVPPTGSPLLPHGWSPGFWNSEAQLDRPPEGLRWLFSARGLTPTGIPAWPGLVRITLWDVAGRSLPSSDVIALFAFDGGRLSNTLVGLAGGAFANRRLRLTYRPGPHGGASGGSTVWLEEL
jgi:hypothetical protein